MRFRALAALSLAILLVSCGDDTDPGRGGTAGDAPAGVSEWDVRFTDLEAVDANTAFAVGAVEGKEASLILKTTDGGARWAAVVRLPDSEVVAVDFVDPRNGAAITTGGALLVTGDGGENWSPVRGAKLAPARLPGGEAIVNGLAVAGGAVWAVGSRENDEGESRPMIASSKDGGATWSEAKLDPKLPPVALTRVAFADAQTGFATGGEPEDETPELLLGTTDGGASWKRLDLSTGQSPSGLALAGAQRGWLVGQTIDEATGDAGPSSVYVTEDGGKTWSAQKKLPVSLLVVRFADATHGWAAGTSSKIFRTQDGGTTWTEQTSQDRASGVTLERVNPADANAAEAPVFYGLVMLSPERGLAPSDRGVFEVRLR